ncbi:hypothetical protein [Acetobacterium wieringae]|uniref:Glycosyltransferase family 4 protein n=1 Tax=Acetobacterium wieringae TaxID=52694 RepID=A0A1F2PKT3_9FIRM|nr:hypothetical protein [Acetobacterium wieringae]OFV71341.1 hypothetical protein ACWI_12550 [Acetobacterium wieringae]
MKIDDNLSISKQKIALVLPSNIRYAPFYRKYEDILVKNDIPFDLIYWNRENIIEDISGTLHSYSLKDRVNSKNYLKIIKYFGFARYVKKKLEREKYNKVIFLGSNAGTVALLSSHLAKKFKDQYWLDIRDYTYEYFGIYYKYMETAIKNSFATAISSEGYKIFLPKHDYINVHNIDINSIEASLEKRSTIIDEITLPIRISFIGLVRYYEENKRLIKALGNDSRFLIQYFGQNSDVLKKYCEENNIRNVNFVGRFEPCETAEFYSKTDIINNIYGNNGLAVTTALSNKLYFAAALNIPILVSPNTYMDEITKQYSFGYSVDFDANNLADELFLWYERYRNNNKNQNKLLWSKAIEENKEFESKFMEFISF